MSRRRIAAAGSAVVLLAVIAIVAVLAWPSPNGGKSDGGATYANPVFEPVLADPSVIRADDGTYYAYGTEDNWGDGNPDHLVPIVRSRDLVHWAFVNDAFTLKPFWKDDGGGLWAPDISRHDDGKYYLYYAMSIWGDPDPGIGLAVSDKPEGPFEDQGKVFLSDEIGVGNSIDPMYFRDDDGKAYLFWGSFAGIYGVQLSDDGRHAVGDKFEVAGTAYEAPYVVKRSGAYYLFVSSGSCCDGANSTYRVSVGKAESVKGPYRDRDGMDMAENGGTAILSANASANAEGKRFVGPGHNAIVRDDGGQDWILYHAIDESNPFLLSGATRRPLMIDLISWKDGWPEVAGGSPSLRPRPAPIVKGRASSGTAVE